MMLLRLVILTLSLIFYSGDKAEATMYDNDSCVLGQGLLNRVLDNLATLGLFTAVSKQFSMDGAGTTPDKTKCSADYYPDNCSGSSCNGNPVIHDSKSCTSCKTSSGTSARCSAECNVADATGCQGGATCSSNCNSGGGVKICYEYYTLSPGGNITTAKDCNWARNGWHKSYLLPPAVLRVTKVGDQLCAQAWTFLGYQSIGCKYLPDCSKFSVNSNCYVAQACSYNGFKHSYGLVPMTAMIMECIKESLDLLFINTTACGDATSYKTNYFPIFQASMRKAVKAAITIYFILFGIKMVMSGEVTSKSEYFVFGAKYILVLYFSVGIFMNKYETNGTPIYSDGVNTIMKPLFVNGASDLANMVYQAGGVNGLCDYSTRKYDPGYQYISLWDSIDCRILYYLGLDLSRISNLFTTGGVEIALLAVLSMLGPPVMLSYLVAAFFSFQIIFFVFSIIFVVFLISIMVYFVNIIVLCNIAGAILIYMCPIFVPMALFAPTKSYFDGWLKLLISYTLQPMVVMAYMAMMLTIFDNAMFGDCSFQNKSITINFGTYKKDIPFFVLCDPWESSCPSNKNELLTKCKQTIGYQVNPVQNGRSFVNTLQALFFSIPVLNPSVVGNMMTGLITLCIFAYLFYKFASVLSEFAAELTGGTNIGRLAGNPMGIVDKGVQAVKAATKMLKAYVKAKAGDTKGAMEDGKGAMDELKKDEDPSSGGSARKGVSGGGGDNPDSGAKPAEPG